MSGDFDRVDRLLEKRHELLMIASGLLASCVRTSCLMTLAEQNAWDWAMQRAGELETEFDALIADIMARRYYPGLVPMQPGGYRQRTVLVLK